MVQYYYPFSLSASRLDRYLAEGWFRGSGLLYRSSVICLKKEIYSVINVRLPLESHSLRKSHSRLLRKNDKRFRVEVGRVQPTDEKNRMYESQKSRFKGFVFPNIEYFLSGGLPGLIFNTKELRVFDGEKLVALSYFDIGDNSVASLLGLFDPDYAEFSLGTYTMLKEIEIAMADGKSFYYPGYVLKELLSFNYKLRLGDMQYYNWRGHWRCISKLEEENWAAQGLRAKMDKVFSLLQKENIACHQVVNEYFSLGYMDMGEREFLKSPIFIEFEEKFDNGNILLLEYHQTINRYSLIFCKKLSKAERNIMIETRAEFWVENEAPEDLKYMMEILMESADPQDIVAELLNL